MVKVMETAIKFENKIKGGHNALSHRKFKAMLESLNAEYGDLLLYTEVRWLSRGKCLQRLFDLRKEVVIFLEPNATPEYKDLIALLKN